MADMQQVMAKLHDGTHHAVLVKKGSVVRKADEEDAMSKQTKVQKQNAAIVKHVKGKKAAKAHAVSPATHSIMTGELKARAKKEGGKMSGLDAAAKVLADHGKPLSCKVMVEAMLAQKLWSTGGKTPDATIYSAVIREIATKGSASRFVKVGRGEFAINTPAKA
jgi:hypothetical protein